MTKKEQLLYLREQAKKSGDANLKKLIVIAAKSGSQSAENQKKIWSKVGSVVDKFKNAEKAAEKAQKASVAKKVASKPKKASKPVAKKAKPATAPKPKKKSGRGPKSRGETFFGRAKMIREENPSLTWKEAQAEAKKFFADEKSRKAKAVQDAIKSFPDLKRATKDTTNIQKDAAQPAMPPGKRKSRPGAKRKFYWETRSNRSDIRQPSKKYPMLEKGGNRFKRGGKIDRDNYYPFAVAGRPEWKQIYDLTDKDPDEIYATLSPAQLELLKRLFNAQTSNGITTFVDVGQGILVRSKSGIPSKELVDIAIASVAEVPSLGGFQMQGKNELFIDYMPAEEFKDVIVEMMDSEIEFDGSDFLEAKMQRGAGYPFEKGGSLNTVLVKFDDPKYNYRTSVSARTTEESARQYFIGMPVNVGSYPKEVFKRVVDIEFNPPGEKMQKGGFVSESEMQSAFRRKDLSNQMGMAVDEDGFPEDLEISGALRKMMREDEKFAEKVQNAIMQTANMDSGDATEASRIFRELGIDMDYDLGGEPSGMSLLKKGGRFQKGGSVVIRSPKGKNAPNLIQRVDDKMWFMWTQPRPYGRISCQPLVGYYQTWTTQDFLDDWFSMNGAIDSAEAVDWQWMSSDSIFIEKLKREKVTDFEYEMMSVKSRKLTSANDSAIVRSGLVEMGVPEKFAEEATKIIIKGRNLEKGGKVSKFDKLSKKVAKSYKGKKVPKRFQSEYGKTYDAQEAREVGDKVAAKVYRLQQKKK